MAVPLLRLAVTAVSHQLKETRSSMYHLKLMWNVSYTYEQTQVLYVERQSSKKPFHALFRLLSIIIAKKG